MIRKRQLRAAVPLVRSNVSTISESAKFIIGYIKLVRRNTLCFWIVTWAVTFLLATTSTHARDTQSEKPIDVSSRTLTFDEDFNDIDLSADGGGGHRWYMLRSLGNPVPPSLLSISDGVLSISTPPDDHYGANTSIATLPQDGHEGTPTLFNLGYFEARLRFDPNANNWPAFWLFSETGLLHAMGQLPNSVESHWCEIDIMEGISSNTYGGTVHDWRSGQSAQNVQNKNALITLPPETNFREWNVFGVLWTTNKIVWYFNGRPVSSTSTPSICQSEQMFIIIGSAKYGGAETQTIDVDWIRVYK